MPDPGGPRAPDPAARGAPGAVAVYGHRSLPVVVLYAILALALIYFSRGYTLVGSTPVVSYFLAAVTVFFMGRYLLTQYRLDSRTLTAWRPLGSRRVPLELVRRIEYANLRELGPIGMFASWGYRGRMWSPVIGYFDAIYTDSRGLLVTAGEFPLFISPADPDAFAQELSRRVRSFTGPLDVDVGSPQPSIGAAH